MLQKPPGVWEEVRQEEHRRRFLQRPHLAGRFKDLAEAKELQARLPARGGHGEGFGSGGCGQNLVRDCMAQILQDLGCEALYR